MEEDGGSQTMGRQLEGSEDRVSHPFSKLFTPSQNKREKEKSDTSVKKEMRKSHMARESEGSKYGEDFEFNPALDFSEFLDEARRHRSEEVSSRAPSPVADIDTLSEVKKSKKSWKNSLVSWWPKAYKKFEKKSKSRVEPASGSQSSNPIRNHVSGPLHTKSSGTGKPGERPHRSSSGPLTGFFRSSWAMENETPYAALEHIDPRRAKQYGPVYFVT